MDFSNDKNKIQPSLNKSDPPAGNTTSIIDVIQTGISEAVPEFAGRANDRSPGAL